MARILIIISILFSLSCHAQVTKFKWLVGTWKLKQKDVYEVWSLSQDQLTLEGFSYRVKNNDTTRMEVLKITFDGHYFHYIPDVPGNQGPVDFTFTSFEDDRFIAENPKHDFPKLIRYKFIQGENSQDQMEAAIEGNGKVIRYHFERMR